ncbi:MAG: hydroxymethylbilane synthase [Eubacteriales bacterium]|nr:hydroxymethylbilane synthase [Eubacteriales bacterium]
MKTKVIIGSRESALAVAQSEMVKAFIESENPGLEVEILTMKTTGDKILDRTLDQVGGKGLFVKELDLALRDGRSDLSVHSLKDVPAELPEDLPLLAFSKREDPRDVLVLPEGETKLDPEKPLGCSSRRRTIQLRELYPDMQVKSIRGNLQTRLRKLDSGEYAGLILAAAGLKRLGLEHRIARYFSVEEMIPSSGQGILAVQGRSGEDTSYLQGYEDPKSAACALAERAYVRRLDGGCSSPIAAHARVKDGTFSVLGLYYREEDGAVFKGEKKGKMEDAVQIGRSLAEELLETARQGK